MGAFPVLTDFQRLLVEAMHLTLAALAAEHHGQTGLADQCNKLSDVLLKKATDLFDDADEEDQQEEELDG